MATRPTVTKALGMFVLAGLGGDVSAERITVYTAALDDVTDEQLVAATARLLKSHQGGFIPTPAVIRSVALPPVTLDVPRLLQEIADLAGYCPNGNHGPRVETVRRAKGDGVADAYAAVGGGTRIYADDATTRDIARREFGKEMEEIRGARGADALLPPAPVAPPRLTSGEATAATEAPVAVPFDWRAAPRPDAPKPDTTKLEEAAAAGDELAAKYLARKRRVAA